jgi:hypothetical protein
MTLPVATVACTVWPILFIDHTPVLRPFFLDHTVPVVSACAPGCVVPDTMCANSTTFQLGLL